MVRTVAFLIRTEEGRRIIENTEGIARLIEEPHRLSPGGWYSVISLHGGGSPEATKREIWRNYPVMEKVEVVETLLDRGVLNDGRRVSKQLGRCCATGCEGPALPSASEAAPTAVLP
jgi:4-hydroxybutyryl-CoA dehydratase / vinylacetyl-CoA-Delta-isomerase